jgi:hypothetical protein
MTVRIHSELRPMRGSFMLRLQMAENDIYRLAQDLVDDFGEDALKEAVWRINAFLDEGNVDAVEQWECVLRTVKIFLSGHTGTVH